MNAKILRLSRISCYKDQNTCIVPIDHATTMGPIEGLENSLNLIRSIISGNADAIILHKGLLKKVNKYPEFSSSNFILHLSVSTILGEDPSRKVLVANVEEALKLGAVGVSVHLNIGTKYEPEMIKDFSCISEACFNWGMPLLAMIYSQKGEDKFSEILHAARLGEELGADIVKIDYPGTIEKMKKITDCVDIPVLISGGKRTDKLDEILQIINNAMIGGAKGVSIGRNIFQSENPAKVTKMFSELIKSKIYTVDHV